MVKFQTRIKNTLIWIRQKKKNRETKLFLKLFVRLSIYEGIIIIFEYLNLKSIFYRYDKTINNHILNYYHKLR